MTNEEVALCPLCGREKLKDRVHRPPPTAKHESLCLHPAHIYGQELPPCEAIGVRRIAQLQDALRRYGKHDDDCVASVIGAAGDTRCTCGYDEACA
jgi:hypothetical protein